MELLTDLEVRVLGALVEKSVTTPEYYPLSLNALVNACNQKSNRDPVLELDSPSVGEALVSLREKALTHIVMGGDSRVPKYRHYFDEAYSLTAAETALLCELMLRGPQTVGELRGRIERFNVSLSLAEVEALLEALAARAEPLVVKLPRQPGRKDPRYAHLLAGMPNIEETEAEPTRIVTPQQERIANLENEVQQLRAELDELKEQFTEFRKQFE